MPLFQSKSKKAFGENVKAEMNAGKPMNQSLAIAYNVKRHNARKMASGGMVSAPKSEPSEASHAASIAHAILASKNGYAAGGKVVDGIDEAFSDAGDVEAQGESGDEFLSSPDAPDYSEPVANELGDEDEKRKMRLSSILASVRMRNMGK